MKNCVVSSVLALTVSTPALAQELVYADAGVGFAYLEAFEDEIQFRIINGQAEFVLDQFFFGAELSYAEQEYDDGTSKFTGLGAQVGYMPVDGLMFGLLYRQGQDSFSGSGSSGEFETSEIEYFGQYEAAQFGVAVTHSQGEFDGFSAPYQTTLLGRANVTPEVALLAAVDLREDSDEYSYNLGARYEAGPIEAVATYFAFTGNDGGYVSLAGMYDINPQLAVTARYATATNSEFDDSQLNLEGAYDLNDQFTILAGYSKFFSDFGDDSQYQVGAEYNVAANTDISVTYLETLEGEFDSTGVVVALTYEFGETMRLDRRIEDDFGIESVFGEFIFGRAG
jgi:hypothetical protein